MAVGSRTPRAWRRIDIWAPLLAATVGIAWPALSRQFAGAAPGSSRADAAPRLGCVRPAQDRSASVALSPRASSACATPGAGLR